MRMYARAHIGGRSLVHSGTRLRPAMDWGPTIVGSKPGLDRVSRKRNNSEPKFILLCR